MLFCSCIPLVVEIFSTVPDFVPIHHCRPFRLKRYVSSLYLRALNPFCHHRFVPGVFKEGQVRPPLISVSCLLPPGWLLFSFFHFCCFGETEIQVSPVLEHVLIGWRPLPSFTPRRSVVNHCFRRPIPRGPRSRNMKTSCLPSTPQFEWTTLSPSVTFGVPTSQTLNSPCSNVDQFQNEFKSSLSRTFHNPPPNPLPSLQSRL